MAIGSFSSALAAAAKKMPVDAMAANTRFMVSLKVQIAVPRD
jgi:hypothetical protein